MKKVMCLVAVLVLGGCSKVEEATDNSSVKPSSSSVVSSSEWTVNSSITSVTSESTTPISSEPIVEATSEPTTEPELPVISEADLAGKVYSGEAIFDDGSRSAYTISFNAVKNPDLEGDVLFTSFPGSMPGTMEYFDRMTIVVTGPNSYRVTAEQPNTDSVTGQSWITLDIVKHGENQIEFRLGDKYFVLTYDEQVTSQLNGS